MSKDDGSQVSSSAAISVADADLKKILEGIHAWHSGHDEEDKQNKTSPRNPFNENSYKEEDKINARKKFLDDLDKYYNDAESKSNGVGSSFIKPEEIKALDEDLQKHIYYHNDGPKKIDKPTDNHKALSYTIPGNQESISIVHHDNSKDKKDEIFISEKTIARLKEQTSTKGSDPVVIAVDRIDKDGNRMKGAKDYLIFQNGELIVEASVDADGNPKGQTRIQGLEHIVEAHAMNREHYKEHMLGENIGVEFGNLGLLPKKIESETLQLLNNLLDSSIANSQEQSRVRMTKVDDKQSVKESETLQSLNNLPDSSIANSQEQSRVRMTKVDDKQSVKESETLQSLNNLPDSSIANSQEQSRVRMTKVDDKQSVKESETLQSLNNLPDSSIANSQEQSRVRMTKVDDKQTSGVKDNKEPNMSDRQKLMEAISSNDTNNITEVIMNLDDAFETINSCRSPKHLTPLA